MTSGNARGLLDLLRDGRAGSETAFVAFFEATAGHLGAFLWSILRDAHEAEEVRQECFLACLQAKRLPRCNEEVRPWLFAIARRAATDRLRRREVRSRRREAWREGTEEDASLRDADPGAVPDDAARRELRARLARALDDLPAAQREVVLLHHYGGLTFAEISQTVGAPRGTVLARMRYAVQKLRNLLPESLREELS